MGDLARAWGHSDGREPTEGIVEREVAAALRSYPNAEGDETLALALAVCGLRKTLQARTQERDQKSVAYAAACMLLALVKGGVPVNSRIFMERLRRNVCPVTRHEG